MDLLLEGEAGVGKTEIAKVLAASLGRPLIRLQCYEQRPVDEVAVGKQLGFEPVAVEPAAGLGEADRHQGGSGQDRDRQGAGGQPRAAADPAAMLRGARRRGAGAPPSPGSSARSSGRWMR
jgi:hypothetical protein